MTREIIVDDSEEKALRAVLEARTDAEALRMRRFLGMPDLSRTPGSPLHDMVERILALPIFAGFDVIKIPEIVPVDVNFDLFDFPPDHPARSTSDTYYADPTHILRTHCTTMWYYYLLDPEVKARMAAGEPVGAFCFGKVYRKDEIDRRHMNVFHQLDGWYLAPKEKKVITKADLEEVLSGTAKAIFGPQVKYRFNEDTFPYTDPSLEMEVEIGGQWVEVNGAGVVKGSVLEKFGIDSTRWTGWAFGLGLERLAIISMELPDIRLLWSADERVRRQLKLGSLYKEVSKYPPIIRDISFVVGKDFVPNNYFDLIRDIGGDLIEEVSLTDKYENAEKFGPDRTSYTYRIVYRSTERTLQTEEIEPLQAKVIAETKRQFAAEIR